MKREYKITKSNLGYNVYRKKEEGGIISMERLQRDTYTLNRDFARTFYNLDDAISALTIAKAKGEKETPTISIKKSGWVDLEERK